MLHPPPGQRPDTRPPRDGDPTARLEADDARTLATLYDRHAGAMYSLAMRIAGEPEDAEAIVQAVFAAAWASAGHHPGGLAPNAHWLLGTTRVRAIDHVRGGSAAGDSTSAVPEIAGDDVPPRTPPGDVATLYLPDPARGQVTDEQGPEDVPRLRSAFRGLPPLERLAIELAYFEGLTISQLAMRLEQAPEAANARIRTGLRRLAGSVGAPRMSEPRRDMPPTPELTGLYALGALNASERAAFDAHLEVHREAVDEVHLMLPVARRLAWTVPPHEPPAGLRERVMETVTGAPLPGAVKAGAAESSRSQKDDAADESSTQDASKPAADADPSDGSGTAGDAEPGADRTGSVPAETHDSPRPAGENDSAERAAAAPGATEGEETDEPPRSVDEAAPPARTPLSEEPASPMQQTAPTEEETPVAMPTPTPDTSTQGGRWAVLALVAVSLVAAAGLGLVAARQRTLATALQENLDAANTQARIAELETAAAERIADALRGGAGILTADDVQTLDLAGQPAASDARGRLFRSAGGAFLAATGLPPAPPGRVYQLWLIPAATPMSAGVLSVGADGRAMATVTLPQGVTGPVPAALTLEPAGGVESPGGDVYLLGRP